MDPAARDVIDGRGSPEGRSREDIACASLREVLASALGRSDLDVVCSPKATLVGRVSQSITRRIDDRCPGARQPHPQGLTGCPAVVAGSEPRSTSRRRPSAGRVSLMRRLQHVSASGADPERLQTLTELHKDRGPAGGAAEERILIDHWRSRGHGAGSICGSARGPGALSLKLARRSTLHLHHSVSRHSISLWRLQRRGPPPRPPKSDPGLRQGLSKPCVRRTHAGSLVPSFFPELPALNQTYFGVML